MKNPLGSRRPAQASVKHGYPLKSGYFTALGSCSNNDKLFIGVNIDDIE